MMEMHNITSHVRVLDGALVVTPTRGDDAPEIAWGDAFFYFAPDGRMPERTQPYATIVTKDYPDDSSSELDAPGRFRVNIHVGGERVAQLVDEAAQSSDADAFVRHPLYGDAGWVSVVNPAERTGATVLMLLRDAHHAAQERAARRMR
jgi:hypothetical protein